MAKQKKVSSWDDVEDALDTGRLIFEAGEIWGSRYEEMLCDMFAILDGHEVASWTQAASGASDPDAGGELKDAFGLCFMGCGTTYDGLRNKISEACIEATPAVVRGND